jgi:MoaA/NifB/PqqE/SkfB family radical SAM enzyme
MKKEISPYLYVGYSCNNNCIFCSEADEYLEELKPKTFDQIKKEILEIKKEYDFITLMGREPTLRKDIFDILNFAKKIGFKRIGLTSNGRMLSYPDFAKRVLDTGVGQVGISLSGATAEIHDKLTQVPGSFKQTVRGIYNISSFKKPEVSLLVNLTLTKMNYFEFRQMVDLVTGLGVKEINILFIAPLSKRSRSKKIVMNMTKLGHYVFRNLKPYLKREDLKFLLVEFLPCSLPRGAKKYFFPCLERNPNKVKIPICKNCEYKDQCDGVLQDYINLYGTKEFKL